MLFSPRGVDGQMTGVQESVCRKTCGRLTGRKAACGMRLGERGGDGRGKEWRCGKRVCGCVARSWAADSLMMDDQCAQCDE